MGSGGLAGEKTLIGDKKTQAGRRNRPKEFRSRFSVVREKRVLRYERKWVAAIDFS